MDELILESLEGQKDVFQKKPKQNFFPYLCLLNPKDHSRSSKLVHPLLPKSTGWLKKEKIPYSYLPFLLKKGREKAFQGAVILDSSKLGL
jgi:hypothetical protein